MAPSLSRNGKTKQGKNLGSNKKLNDIKQEVNVEQEEINFDCDLCAKRCGSLRGLNNHVTRIHKRCQLSQEELIKTNSNSGGSDVDNDYNNLLNWSPAKKIKCTYCSKLFKLKSNYKLHLVKEHYQGPGSFHCDLCSVKCKVKKDLEKHILSTHLQYEFECALCGATFVRAYHVTRHLKQGGCKKYAGQKRYSCEICNASFSRKDNLMVHLRHHITKTNFKCKFDDKSFTSYNKLIRHWESAHTDRVYTCAECGHTCKARTTLSKHIESHGDRKYQCEICKYKSHTVEVMRRHVLRHTKDKPYKCDMCGVSFIQLLQLRKHLYKHSGNKCHICLKSFDKVYELEGHVREHKSVEKLLCPHEGCKFNKLQLPSVTAYKRHMLLHDPVNQLSCELCLRSFPSELALRKHLVTHQLERPRRCMYCVSPRAYVRGEMLLRHVRTRHPAIFAQHLAHVREVMGTGDDGRVKKSELESVLDLLDAVCDRIMEHTNGEKVLFCCVEDTPSSTLAVMGPPPPPPPPPVETKTNLQILSECELSDNLQKLLVQLIDENTLKILGWPEETVDTLLEKVIEKCGERPADRGRWSRVQCLRENAKHLFVHVIEDKTISRMLSTHTIDQVVLHILDLHKDTHNEFTFS